MRGTKTRTSKNCDLLTYRLTHRQADLWRSFAPLRKSDILLVNG